MTDPLRERTAEPETVESPAGGLAMMGEPGAGECVDGVCAVPGVNG
ncbi:hypothetical protein G1H11_01780 [Phytoactinopolyspora alkaliphila]|uniref:Uncharacterized protein n=1 Tax=Phytoactinopolyspora alkaliphila TaxID=1783498 RepID=A0A6N9YGJ2_9ACTN|nr:hypothetical protein [Phytoactinopolyspora alkaliphila]NED94035.1 hypothetical protein [Phytoactinopolyspora alkaliphila]